MTMETKVLFATIKLIVKNSADAQDICSETDYHFKHVDILNTEWIEIDEQDEWKEDK